MAEKFNNRFRIASSRLPFYDYGSNGEYFVTICTKNRKQYLGNIIATPNNEMQLSEIGHIAYQNWLAIPEHFPFVQLDDFQVMPDHLHGILIIKKDLFTPTLKQNKFAPQSQNLSSIIRGYKASVKTYAVKNQIEFYWQSRFHEHIIRNAEEFQQIKFYIGSNVANWKP